MYLTKMNKTGQEAKKQLHPNYSKRKKNQNAFLTSVKVLITFHAINEKQWIS
jgi:hypothetical protein